MIYLLHQLLRPIVHLDLFQRNQDADNATPPNLKNIIISLDALHINGFYKY